MVCKGVIGAVHRQEKLCDVLFDETRGCFGNIIAYCENKYALNSHCARQEQRGLGVVIDDSIFAPRPQEIDLTVVRSKFIVLLACTRFETNRDLGSYKRNTNANALLIK